MQEYQSKPGIEFRSVMKENMEYMKQKKIYFYNTVNLVKIIM